MGGIGVSITCIWPLVKGPRSPPFLAELQSEWTLASSANFWAGLGDEVISSLRRPAAASETPGETESIAAIDSKGGEPLLSGLGRDQQGGSRFHHPFVSVNQEGRS
jgi:hypothetical protein